jgi:hypothetical protein
MKNGVIDTARSIFEYLRLPPQARREYRRDINGLPSVDPGIHRAVDAAVGWLCRAQDRSRSADGGVARHFSLLDGWSSSYPETTGYIVPTLVAYGKATHDTALLDRATRMLDWLAAIQLPEGGFQGGLIDSRPLIPVTFNTGQILLGLACGAAEFGDAYIAAMRKAADWLKATQDPDGCWRSHPTPFAGSGEKAYETHVAWGLLEADRMAPGNGYADAALANIRWALQFQKANGWFDKCCLVDPARPLTHTLGYVLRGLLEAYRYTEERRLLDASRRTADGLLGAIHMPEGYLPGRLLPDWQAAVPWSCLTGAVQIAYCWLKLYTLEGDRRYRDAAFAANRFVRRAVRVDGPEDQCGGVKGSFPIYGPYGRFEYLNWACKFFIDANFLEKEIRGNEGTLTE